MQSHYGSPPQVPAVLSNFLTFLPSLATLADSREEDATAEGEVLFQQYSMASGSNSRVFKRSISTPSPPLTSNYSGRSQSLSSFDTDSPFNNFLRSNISSEPDLLPSLPCSPRTTALDLTSSYDPDKAMISLEERFANLPRPILSRDTSISSSSSSSSGRTDAVASITSGEEQELICWQHGCQGRKFSTRGNYVRHCRERSEARQKHTCGQCGASFSRSSARDKHVAGKRCLKTN